MNCNDFESIVLGQPRNEGLDESALEHSASCAGCRAQLQALNELRASLRTLARHDERMAAPPHIEAVLVEAIRGGSRAAAAGSSAWQLLSVPKLRLALAAAAALILIALASIIYTRSRGQAPTLASHDAPRTVLSQSKDSKQEDPGQSSGSKETTKRPEGPQPALRDEHPRFNNVRLARNNDSAARRANRKNPNGSEASDNNEIATDFFPISYGSYLQPLDGGHVVRVRLPRSALMNYGLPVDPLRADEAIKADVVIGNDGMAHAIRFVH